MDGIHCITITKAVKTVPDKQFLERNPRFPPPLPLFAANQETLRRVWANWEHGWKMDLMFSTE